MTFSPSLVKRLEVGKFYKFTEFYSVVNESGVSVGKSKDYIYYIVKEISTYFFGSKVIYQAYNITNNKVETINSDEVFRGYLLEEI